MSRGSTPSFFQKWENLPPIDRANRFLECFNWYGENLSRKEWTALRLTVNGTELPEYALFQRCYRGSENELELPDGVLRDGGSAGASSPGLTETATRTSGA